jgi:hypothetical protein
MQAEFNQIKFTDTDVVNKADFIPAGEYNPHNVRPFLLCDHGFVVVLVFADCLQDALDIAVDEGKLDGFQIDEDDLGDYGPDEEGITRLGNASEPFDIGTLDALELPNPPFSFAALFNASTSQAKPSGKSS